MAYKNKYQLMNASVVTDENGDYYPDLATFPLNQLRITERPTDYKLNQNDIYRFFDLCYEYYNSFDLYDYLTLWLNDITDISNEDNFEKSIKFYGKNDIDKWYIENIKTD
jgi:hypothetical protein